MALSSVGQDASVRSCHLCQVRGQLVFRAEHKHDGVCYTLWECRSCGGQAWDPFENPGATWYQHDERYAARNANPILRPNKKHIDTLSFFGKKVGTVLDVGCGVGNFLAHAELKGWKVWGIDFDVDAIDAGKKTFGLAQLEVASIEEFMEHHPDLRFDLITFFDVFEHLDNHNEFLGEIRKMVKPKGHIALSVPYRHAWRWLIPADLPPRHLTRWDESSLETILTRHGFSVKKIGRLPAGIYYIALKLRFRFGAWSSFNLVQRIRQDNKVSLGTNIIRTDNRVSLVQALAQVKDLLLFGIPSIMLWIALLPYRMRYTDLYIIAQREGIE